MQLLTACVTPFFPNGMIDFASLKNLLFRQEKEENGIILLGSTGESLALTIQEKKDIVAFACNCNLTVPLIIGVSGVSLYEAYEWISWCCDYPITGFLMTSPVYANPGIHGQTLWFESLLNRANRPAILYNIPSRAGTPLYVETVKALAQHPCFLGIKDSGRSIATFREYASIDTKCTLYCGDDSLWPQMCVAGAHGLISVLSNGWPKEAKDYVKDCGDPLRSLLWEETCHWLNQTTNPIAIKALLAYMREISHFSLRLPLSKQDFHYQHSISKIVKRMTLWSKVCLSI
ncbi:4-hydroxy-tetrahydrodipicolinate synthase [Chlamydia gallinacea]|uniref:4-hydroxy-tetrahydrodipicolinate synthase n=2 Tax=Chlamydia gallinacea TaxID=1457153 RepID=A0A173DY01_9CHLA|nr:4-hydroxy-tetrahydrodipicolinate synthase [Chlamydia gallinacea]EYE60893.1 dihydrodipicolinate synthase [Bacteroides fragilis str. S6L5]ANG65789.1 4-hydroxy-tetrahydrodipicolinate synthase [Chlamydia gallinacea 08-1274/3]AQT77150.1 4-hydroxy-tetrahydrodipicolinate synthase [Chlamydia gallinacea]MBX6680346.1 4-hydroxy-tetrahydrodipicolinate synthase [Chlamydia gallinacea]MBX6687532.1 4-hydroxy-tetrahydrodipicolinate synthase [Chlamydia gallinacea]